MEEMRLPVRRRAADCWPVADRMDAFRSIESRQSGPDADSRMFRFVSSERYAGLALFAVSGAFARHGKDRRGSFGFLGTVRTPAILRTEKIKAVVTAVFPLACQVHENALETLSLLDLQVG